MTSEQYDKIIKICGKIVTDARQDAKDFDGQPFTGKVVATYLGYQGASIATLAEILKTLALELQRQNNTSTQ